MSHRVLLNILIWIGCIGDSLVDAFSEMAPEQLKQVETALHSEKAKQILGDDVSTVLGRRFMFNFIIYLSFYIYLYIYIFLCTPVYFFEWCWSLVLRNVDAINIILAIRSRNSRVHLLIWCCFLVFDIDTLKLKEEDDWVHFDHCYTNIYGNRKSSPSPCKIDNVVVQVASICSVENSYSMTGSVFYMWQYLLTLRLYFRILKKQLMLPFKWEKME